MQAVTITQISPTELKDLIETTVNNALLNKVSGQETKQNELLTIQQAATMLHCSVPTLYSKHSKGEIPGVSKVGKRLLFNESTLRNWVVQNEHKTADQIKEAARESLANRKGAKS
jgi:excisionase family DNA binding protein